MINSANLVGSPTVEQRQKMGMKIFNLRERRGWTQVQMAERIGVSSRCMSHWEGGRYMPSLLMAKKISDLFDITIDELVRGVE